jgi:hypothetical protein
MVVLAVVAVVVLVVMVVLLSVIAVVVAAAMVVLVAIVMAAVAAIAIESPRSRGRCTQRLVLGTSEIRYTLHQPHPPPQPTTTST